LRAAFRYLAAAVLAALAVPSSSPAALITQNTGGTASSVVPLFFGQPFTTPAGGPWDNLAFNFFADTPTPTPVAFGVAYLLTQPYDGPPAGLSPAVPGFLAQSTGISGGQYVFAPSVTVQPLTQYFLYEQRLIPTGAITGGNIFIGANDFFMVDAITPLTSGRVSANYALTGTAAVSANPEPATLAMLGAGLATLAGYGWRRRQAA
jgi:hypothetical protein